MRKLLFKFLKKELEEWISKKAEPILGMKIIFIYMPSGDKYERNPAVYLASNTGDSNSFLVIPHDRYYKPFAVIDVRHKNFKKDGEPYWDYK